MNTICCNNCKISINYNNGISYQSHYLSISFPCNVCALKCQNIPQKLQVRNCFSQNKKRFLKKIAVSLSRTVYMIIVAHFYVAGICLSKTHFFPFLKIFLTVLIFFKRKNTLFSKNSQKLI